jgi:hypothetical protein
LGIVKDGVVEHHHSLAALQKIHEILLLRLADLCRHVVEHHDIVLFSKVGPESFVIRHGMVPMEFRGLIKERIEGSRIIVPAGHDEQAERRRLRRASRRTDRCDQSGGDSAHD